MIEARIVASRAGKVIADYGIWQFLALPRIGEDVSVRNADTNLPIAGKVTAIWHHPQGDHRAHNSAFVTITIAPNT